jgi:hypothetical protein
MPPKADNTVMIEDARIIYRNFAGKEGPYNAKGSRNFGVVLAPELAAVMAQDGWNVKMLRPREDDEEGIETPWLPVALRFDVFPPRIVMITSRNRTPLDEETVDMLDWADIVTCDILVRPYEYNVRGETGIKAYLKTMFITINEDVLEAKYAEEGSPMAR